MRREKQSVGECPRRARRASWHTALATGNLAASALFPFFFFDSLSVAIVLRSSLIMKVILFGNQHPSSLTSPHLINLVMKAGRSVADKEIRNLGHLVFFLRDGQLPSPHRVGGQQIARSR